MGIFSTDFENKLNKHIICMSKFRQFFQQRIMSALLIDPDENISVHDFIPDNGTMIRHFDFSQCEEGDYNSILKDLSSPKFDGYEGIIVDNIDRIPDIEDREDLEYLVRFMLKRENDVPGIGQSMIDFNQLMIGARCKEMPEYLKGKSLQTYIIDVRSY